MISLEEIIDKQKNDNSEYKVSICVTSYNQIKYIPRCLDALLAQRTSFRYKIVIGDDYSTDGSRDLLREYKDRYPDKIDLVFNEKNLGLFQNRRKIFERCNTPYVAFCDGDDYWIDVNCIELKYSFLQNNSGYIGFFTSCRTESNGRVSKETDYSVLKCDDFGVEHASQNLYPGLIDGFFIRNIYRYADATDIDKYLSYQVDDSSKLPILLGHIASIHREDIPTFVYNHHEGSMERSKEINQCRSIWDTHLILNAMTEELLNREMNFKSQMLEIAVNSFYTAIKTKPKEHGDYRENWSQFKYIFNHGYLSKREIIKGVVERGLKKIKI